MSEIVKKHNETKGAGRFTWLTNGLSSLWNNIVSLKKTIMLRGQDSIAHFIPIFACFLSLQNIQEFMYYVHPSVWMSWTAGIVLGFGLLTQAWKLSEMEMDWSNNGYATTFTTTCLAALLSGGIQAAAYARYVTWYWAIPLGFLLPVVFELLVSLSISAYSKDRKESRIGNMQNDLSSEMMIQLLDATKTLDTRVLQPQVEASALEIAKAMLNSTHEDIVAELSKKRKNKPVAKPMPDNAITPKPSAQIAGSESANDQYDSAESLEPNQIASSSEFGVANLPAANEARTEKVQERQSAIMQLFRTYGVMKIEEVQKRLAEDCGIEASDRTLRVDLAKLIDDGELQQPKRGVWDIAAKIHFATEMILPEFSTNGKSH